MYTFQIVEISYYNFIEYICLRRGPVGPEQTDPVSSLGQLPGQVKTVCSAAFDSTRGINTDKNNIYFI